MASAGTDTTYPDFVAYHFLNGLGQLMSMEEDGQQTEKFLKEGFSVDGSSVKGMQSVEKSDLRGIPDEDSFLTIKIGDFVHHRFLANLVDEQGKPHPMDPRGILRNLVDKAHARGLEPYMFSEVEFYVVDQDGNPVDEAGYCSLPPFDTSYEFRHELGKLCKELGMKVKRIHHEAGPGQNEIELNLTPCMKNADDTLLCLWVMEILAAKRNQKILFSPKPFPGKPGNGMHHHILLRDLVTGENVFTNSSANQTDGREKRLSIICKQGIAGLIKYADDITAVFAASHETFERLKPGFEAPIYKAWDFSNRTAMIRVPETSIDMTRFEYRGGDLSGSVHLFGAVLLAAVLKGIEDELEAPPSANFNVEKLSDSELSRRGIHPVPLTFEACIKVLKKSEFLKEALGSTMVQFLIQRNKELIKQAKMTNGHYQAERLISVSPLGIHSIESSFEMAALQAKHLVSK